MHTSKSNVWMIQFLFIFTLFGELFFNFSYSGRYIVISHGFIFLIVNTVEHVICLFAICISILLKCLLMSLAQAPIGLLSILHVFTVIFFRVPSLHYMFQSWVLCHTFGLQIFFSYNVIFIFILFIDLFTNFNFDELELIFLYYNVILVSSLRTFCLSIFEYFPPVFFAISFIAPYLIFKFMIHFEFFFFCIKFKKSKSLFTYNLQLLQYNLMKRLFSPLNFFCIFFKIGYTYLCVCVYSTSYSRSLG